MNKVREDITDHGSIAHTEQCRPGGLRRSDGGYPPAINLDGFPELALQLMYVNKNGQGLDYPFRYFCGYFFNFFAREFPVNNLGFWHLGNQK